MQIIVCPGRDLGYLLPFVYNKKYFDNRINGLRDSELFSDSNVNKRLIYFFTRLKKSFGDEFEHFGFYLGRHVNSCYKCSENYWTYLESYLANEPEKLTKKYFGESVAVDLNDDDFVDMLLEKLDSDFLALDIFL